MGQGRRAINWTPEIDQTIRDMRAGGAVWRVIAEHIGCSEWGLMQHARAAGVDMRLLNPSSDDPARIEHVRRLVAEGLGLARIAAKCGVTRHAVASICCRHGIERAVPVAAAPAETRAYTNRGEPLPAGHPTSWGAITAGTLLEGVPYR